MRGLCASIEPVAVHDCLIARSRVLCAGAWNRLLINVSAAHTQLSLFTSNVKNELCAPFSNNYYTPL